jgi:toxin YoeB
MKSQERSAYILIVDPNFIEDLHYWVNTHAKTASKVMELLEAVRRERFTGIGKPELLKHLGPGIWSRRITQEHRLVYRVDKGNIYFLQGRYHY